MELKYTKEYLNECMRTGVNRAYAVAVGIGDNEGQIFSPDVNEDTYFDIASLGKVLVTSPLILHAAGEGKLGLEDPITRFFPDVPAEKREVTVRQLLTHTSGIVRVPLSKNPKRDGWDAVIAEILDAPLAFAPGKGYQYSCNGMILLGFIAENVYGMSLEKAFETILKAPLGLTRSRFAIGFDEPNYVLCAHKRFPFEGADFTDPLIFDDKNVRVLGYPHGSGGFFFTLADIRRYVRAVLRKDERLYPAPLFAEAERGYTPAGTDQEQVRGLGWYIVNPVSSCTGGLFPPGSFGHRGWTGQNFCINRERQMYVVILTNYTRSSFQRCGTMREAEKLAFFDELYRAIRADLACQGLLNA